MHTSAPISTQPSNQQMYWIPQSNSSSPTTGSEHARMQNTSHPYQTQAPTMLPRKVDQPTGKISEDQYAAPTCTTSSSISCTDTSNTTWIDNKITAPHFAMQPQTSASAPRFQETVPASQLHESTSVLMGNTTRHEKPALAPRFQKSVLAPRFQKSAPAPQLQKSMSALQSNEKENTNPNGTPALQSNKKENTNPNSNPFLWETSLSWGLMPPIKRSALQA